MTHVGELVDEEGAAEDARVAIHVSAKAMPLVAACATCAAAGAAGDWIASREAP